MNKLIPALAALACCGTADAYTITAAGIFDVAYRGDSERGIINPPLAGSGFFEIREGRIVDFEFRMLGLTWTEDDLASRRCNAAELAPTDPLCHAFDRTGFGDFVLATIGLPFAGEQGGVLMWDFLHANFSLQFAGVVGTSDDGQATGGFSSFSHRINVREPGTLGLLGLGLIALAWWRRKG